MHSSNIPLLFHNFQNHGFGEAYAYDSLGRRKSKTQFNHRGETQEVTNYHYKGDSWMVVKETDESGKETLSFGFNEGGKPLSVTYQGQTFWYVYNGHGDVVALTDKDGNVAARYEYDAWGLVTKMVNRFGERVREGIGYIGDLGTGNGSPGSLQGPVDSNGNIVPDYNPDNNSDPQNGSGGTLTGSTLDGTLSDNTLTDSTATMTDETTSTSTAGDTTVGVEQEPTEDITTELVKLNPYRYAGYYWDRKTQYYYLQARYYDPRNGRFLSADTYRGEIVNPLTLNLYVYVGNNPINWIDPSGHIPTPIEAAEMAKHIYTQSGELSGGWTFNYVITGGDNMVMGVYYRVKDDGTTEYALVNKGTTITSIDDWANNAQQLFGSSDDMKASIEKSKKFVKNHLNNEITMVGHSKGGAEAAANAVATNRNAIIFNPATVNLGAYGLNSSNYSASMTAFIVKGDALNHVEWWFSEPIDKVVYLPQQYGGHWYNLWKTSPADRIVNHMMGTVIKALKEKEAGYN